MQFHEIKDKLTSSRFQIILNLLRFIKILKSKKGISNFDSAKIFLKYLFQMLTPFTSKNLYAT